MKDGFLVPLTSDQQNKYHLNDESKLKKKKWKKSVKLQKKERKKHNKNSSYSIQLLFFYSYLFNFFNRWLRHHPIYTISVFSACCNVWVSVTSFLLLLLLLIVPLLHRT